MTNEPKIAIILHTTFCRFEMVKKTIESFRYNTNLFRLYVADTGPMTHEKEEYYTQVETGVGQHKVYRFGWDISPAITRNYMIDQIKEPYVFKIDDDFELNWNTVGENVFERVIDLLESDKELGLVGLSVGSCETTSEFIFDVEKNETEIIQRPAKNKEKKMSGMGLRYIECDVTPDCWIAKRSIFPACAYDENYHVGEGLHTDFFLHIKYNTNVKVAYTPDVFIYTFKHDPEWKEDIEKKRDSFYHKKRFRNFPRKDYFLKKWGIKHINKY